jgi:3-deoxy-7-phosphoheptulonate synthase
LEVGKDIVRFRHPGFALFLRRADQRTAVYVARTLYPQANQLSNGETADNIMGVMIESNINEGRQNIPPEGRSR